MMKYGNILICDDETGVRESLKLILSERFSLSYARNGKEALAQLEAHNPDLVIMDIKMPFLNGLETLKKIKALKPHQKVLMVTGYESSDVAAQAIKLGASDYITKPFERHEVKEKVVELLGLPNVPLWKES